MSAQYELTKRIVRTITGEIHEAKEKKSGKTVAIKVSRPLRENKISAENPFEEITVMKKLQEDESVEVEESKSNYNGGRQYIIKLLDTYVQVYKGLECNFNVLEYAECGDIFDMITSKETMSLDSIKRYFRMIVEGVSYLHARNICHLDLSLENILLTKDDEVKICDFGQAQIGRMIKSSGIRRGKLKYMCPEVFQRAEEYDGFKADTWSIGIILWIMLTGAFCYDMPARSDKRFQYLSKGKSGIEVLLHISKADQEEVLVDLLTKIIAIDPLSRLTVQQILEHAWLTGAPSPPPPPPPPTPPPSLLTEGSQIDIVCSSQGTETISVKEISAESVPDSIVHDIITPSMISLCTQASLSSSASSSSSSLPPFSPSSFPPPPPAVAEAPTGAPPVLILALFPDDLSLSNHEPSTYGPLKRSKTNEKARRRRRNSLFRHFSEHRKV